MARTGQPRDLPDVTAEDRREHPGLSDSEIAFRQRIIEVANRYTRRHGWCNEVRNALNEAGLGDFLPKEYVIVSKHTAGGTWGFVQSASTLAGARDVYTRSIQERSRDFERHRLRTVEAPPLHDSTLTTAQLERRMQTFYRARERALAEDPNAVRYPLYAIVSRPVNSYNFAPGAEGVTVVEQEELPVAKKTAAKKTTAKKTAAKKTVAKKTAAKRTRRTVAA